MPFIALWLTLTSIDLSVSGAPGAERSPEGAQPNPNDLSELFADEDLGEAMPFEGDQSERVFNADDFSLYFADGRSKRAKQLFDRHSYRQALLLLPTDEDRLEVKYLRALSALNAGEFRLAAASFEALADRYRPLRDYCLFYAGRAYQNGSRPSQALRLYQSIDPRSRLFGEAQLEIARIEMRERQFRRALELLRRIATSRPAKIDESFAAQVLWTTANVARRISDYPTERNALFKIWSAYPTSPWANEASRRLTSVPIPAAVRVQRAYRLIDRNLDREGDALLLPLLKRHVLAEPLGCAVHFAHGMVLRKARHHAQAIQFLRPVIGHCKDRRLRSRAFLVLAYSQSVLEPEEAIATYEQFVREFPEHPDADEAAFSAADLRLKIGDADSAQSKHADLASKAWLKKLAGEAEFQLFWIHRRAGDLKNALKDLEETEARDDVCLTPGQGARASYWKARTLEQLGRKAEAAAILKALARDVRARFYGFLAEQRLRALDPAEWERISKMSAFPSAAREVWPLNAGNLSWNAHFLAGIELMRMELPGATAELFLANAQDLPVQARQLLFQVMLRGGSLGYARNIAKGLEPTALDGSDVSRLWWETSFPRVFRPSIDRHSQTAGIDPDLMQALIREESLFKTSARSTTGAIGLSQLMLPTARKVGRDLGLKPVKLASLLDADRNIQIGAAYLGQLLKEFSGDMFRAVAAYNAGPQAVRRWTAMNPTSEPDEWVEQLPVAETREYVKRVLGSFYTYRLLFDAQWPKLLADESVGATR